MAGTLPPLFAITDDDHGGYVCVASYTLLILTVLLVVTRVFTRWYVVKFIKADDVLLMVAACLATLQCVFVQLAVNHGLGKKRRTVSDSDFDLYQKYQYAAQMVLILTVSMAKASLAVLIHSLMADRYSLLASRSLLTMIIVWGATAIFTTAFGCSLPHPWDLTGHCINLTTAHDAIWSLDIVTDIFLIVLPCLVFWKVNDPMRRYRVTVLFAARIIVCMLSGIQMHYFNITVKSPDPTWSSMNPTILYIFMMNFSVICTAIPSLGRLIVELQPEVNAFAITEHHGVRNNGVNALNSFGQRFHRDCITSNRPGVRTSILGSRPSQLNGESDEDSVEQFRDNGRRSDSRTAKQLEGFEDDGKYLGGQSSLV